MAATKIFEGVPPASAAGVPGMIAPNITADIQQPMTEQDKARMWELQDRAQAKREAGWARHNARVEASRAKKRAGVEQGRLRSAFNQLYGPQMQHNYHDRMVMAEGMPGTGVQRRYPDNGPNRFSSGNTNPNPNVPYTPPGGWYKMDPNQLNSQLDAMWRVQTDPYMKAAMGMQAAPTSMLAGGSVGASDPAAWGQIYGGRK